VICALILSSVIPTHALVQIEHVWPLYGGYATCEATGVNSSTGETTEYSVLYEGGGLFGKRQAIIFQRFNWTAPPQQ
jgi:hypothetical protein